MKIPSNAVEIIRAQVSDEPDSERYERLSKEVSFKYIDAISVLTYEHEQRVTGGKSNRGCHDYSADPEDFGIRELIEWNLSGFYGVNRDDITTIARLFCATINNSEYGVAGDSLWFYICNRLIAMSEEG